MSRFLVVVPPFVGHVNPTIGVGAELRRRGHEVAWAGHPGLLEQVLPSGATIHACAAPSFAPRPADLRGYAAMKHLWEQSLVPLAESMVPGVERAVALRRPDVLLVDQQALAGALVAEREALPWATSATTSAEFTEPLSGLPKVRQWLAELLAGLRHRFGDPAAVGDLRFSPHLVIAFTTAMMVGAPGVAGGPTCFVGPVARPAVENSEFPWQRLDPSYPLVLISMGTVNMEASGRFLRECVEAMRPRDHLRAVVVDPGCAIANPPEHVIVAPHVPQTALLERTSAVVCHAGHNTVCEALGRGVPLVVAPIRDDQGIVADQVVRAGAGLRLRFAHARAANIGSAIDAVLAEPAYREAAHRVRVSFEDAGGASTAATALERLVSSGPARQELA